MPSPITDPALLAQLNAIEPKPVTDPALLAQLNDGTSVAGDVVKSGGIGLAKGAIGVAGTLGDARDIASHITDAVGDRLGASKEAVQGFKDKAYNAARMLPFSSALAIAPTSHDLQKEIEGVTGDFYKPKTVAGEYAQTAGEFAPGMIGGGEGLLAKLVARVALPAAASETAGQLTKGTDAEPYARIAGGVLGGLSGSLRRAETVAAPTVEELKDSYRVGIDHPDVKAVTFRPDVLDDLHNKIRADLEQRSFRERREINTFADLKELSNGTPTMARAAGAPATVADVESIRKTLGKTAQERGPDFRPTSDAAAASIAVKHIDKWFEGLKQPDLLSGDISRAAPIMKNARGDYAAASRAQDIQQKIDNAALQAGSSYSGGNINNATRQALRPLAKNDFAKAGGYSDTEKDQLSKSILGNIVGNTARSVGKLAPDSGLKAIHHIAAAVATGGASIPGTLASLGAKIGGDYATKRNVQKLDEMLRSRSPLHNQNIASQTQPMLPSPTLPGVMINNPNYIAPAASRTPSTLANLLLSAEAARAQ